MSSRPSIPGVRARVLPARRKLLQQGLSWDVLLLFGAVAVQNGSNYGFHLVISRLLGPAEYGSLAALLALLMVVSVPLGVVQTVVAKRVAILRAEGRESDITALAVRTTKAIAPVALAGLLAVAATSPLIGALLGTQAPAAALLGPFVLLALLTSVPLGVLQGRLQFGRMGAAFVAAVPVRLGLGIVLVAVGLGAGGAILATVLSQAVLLALVFALVGIDGASYRRYRASLSVFRGEVGAALMALTSFWLFAELDILLARHYLGPEEAGMYSSAGLLARALLFVSGAIALVAFPRFAETRGRGATAARALKLSVSAVVVLAVLGWLVLSTLRQPLVSLSFGSGFADAAELLPVLSLGPALLALANLLVYFHIAAGTRVHLLVLAGAAAELVLVAFFHETPAQIGVCAAAVAACVAIAQLHAARAVSGIPRPWRAPDADPDPEPGPAALRDSSPELSVVLPCYNAGPDLADVLQAVRREVETVGNVEILVVSDGSTDETVSVASAFAVEGVRVLQYPRRVGKGHALRVGLSEARGRYVAFIDADGDIDAASLRPFVELMRMFEPDMVLGSKRHPLSEVSYPPLRRLLSWGYHKLGRLLFRIDVRDTQTGLKLIRRDVLEHVLPRMLEKRYAFDLELLVVARKLGFTRVLEAPIRLDYRFSSKIDAAATLRIFVDTLAIFYRRYLLESYAASPEEESAVSCAAARRRFTRTTDPDRHRILILNWRDIRNPAAGGAEAWTHEVAKRWVAQGHAVTLLTSGFKGGPSAETVDGVRIRRIGRLTTGSFHLRVQRELPRVRGFDAVVDEINTIPFLTPLWRRRLPPTLAHVHQLAADVWDAELPTPLATVGRWIEPRLLAPYRDAPVVTISASTCADLRALGFSNVSIVPCGRDDPPDLMGIEKEADPTFLFVGRLAANKRPDHAITAFRLIKESRPEARLWIVGRGPLDRALRTELPVGAELLGHLSREELYQRLARAHCLLVPSVREGWGLVVIEANSVGTPAVGYDVHGIRDSIRDGSTGFLAEPGDPADLARRATELIGDLKDYAEVSDRARAWSGEFSWDRTADELMRMLEREISHGDEPAPRPTMPRLAPLAERVR